MVVSLSIFRMLAELERRAALYSLSVIRCRPKICCIPEQPSCCKVIRLKTMVTNRGQIKNKISMQNYVLENDVSKKIRWSLPLQWDAWLWWWCRMCGCILKSAAIDQFYESIGRRCEATNHLIRRIRISRMYHEPTERQLRHLRSNFDAQHLSLIDSYVERIYAKWRPWCGWRNAATMEWQ